METVRYYLEIRYAGFRIHHLQEKRNLFFDASTGDITPISLLYITLGVSIIWYTITVVDKYIPKMRRFVCFEMIFWFGREINESISLELFSTGVQHRLEKRSFYSITVWECYKFLALSTTKETILAWLIEGFEKAKFEAILKTTKI